MKSGFAVAPKVAHARHHQWKNRREQRLQVITDEEIFLARFAYYRSWIDRVATMCDRVAMKDWIVMPKGIVTVMVSERAFGSAFVWRRVTNQSELSFSYETMRGANRVLCQAQLLSAKQRREDQFRNIFRQRRNRRNDQRGRAAEEDGHG